MLAPDAVEAFVSEYRRTVEADRNNRRSERRELERKRREAAGRVERLTLAIADGAKGFAEIRTMLEAQAAERDRCAGALAELDAEPTILLHPGIAEAYRKNVEVLGETLTGASLDIAEARIALRNLIDCVRVSPAAAGRGSGSSGPACGDGGIGHRAGFADRVRRSYGNVGCGDRI